MNAEVFETSDTTAVKKVNDFAGWGLIAMFAALIALALVAGGGGTAKLLRLVFPLGAAAVGTLLYFRFSSRHYLFFAWWIWFLTPFVRRVIDYRSEWVDPSPVLLAPFLVALVTVCAFFKNDNSSSKLSRRECLPFALPIMGIVYALGIGLIQNSIASVAPMLLNWLIPVLFGFYFVRRCREYAQIRDITQKCFLWMVLIAGVYGIYQFVVAPGWDTSWMINSDAWASGSPEPFGIRVFSTMNSAGPFGVVMMAGLLLLFSQTGRLGIPAAIAGYLSFLLSLSRTSWLGWLVGLATLFVSLPSRAKARLIVVLALMVLFVLPLTAIEPFAETINNRFNTFSNVSDDVSYLDRVEGYEVLFGKAAAQIIGNGLGYKGDTSTGLGIHDSAVLEMLFTLGWLGTFLYSCGLILLMLTLFSKTHPHQDQFANAARAICFGVFAQILLGSVLIAVSGVIFWSFAGMVIAARLHHNQTLDDY